MAVAAALVATAAPAAASTVTFCDSLGGQWDGQYCHTSVTSQRKAFRDIKLALPGEFLDNPTVADYLTTLMNNWRNAAHTMVADSYAEENFETFTRGDTVSLVFHESYHADGPKFNDAYRTFTFSGGRLLKLADLVKPGLDPQAAIAAIAEPFVTQALDEAPPPHDPGTYPFIPDRWTPDKVYSGGYRAWALTPQELILYMPDYPVGHDTPIDFTHGALQWSMNGGTVQARIPLSALSPILQSPYGPM